MKLFKFLAALIIFPLGLLYFLLTHKTFHYSYISLRILFVETNGKINDLISNIISFIIPSYKIVSSNGVLGNLDENNLTQIVKSIQLNGYYKFDIIVDNQILDSLNNFAYQTEVAYLKTGDKFSYSTDKIKFRDDLKISPRFDFLQDDLLKNEAISNLCFDENFLAIANKYLNTKPILDIITMWWSLPFKNSKTLEDKAAQMYHFDMDRIKFLKFFIYVNDVNENNGPHCYVKKSHKKLPVQILKDGRMTDDEIQNYFNSEDILEIKGKAGTILAVDTRGIHKGKPLVEGKRLLFQLQFSNSLFGAPYRKTTGIKLSENHNELKSKYKRTYQLIN